MKILVTGGTGVLGRHVGGMLIERGHDVTIASRHPREIADARSVKLDLSDGGSPIDVEHHDVVVHLASDALDAQSVDVEGTRRLLEWARQTGVRHIVAISIVGIDDHPFPYYRAKAAMEREIEGGDVPWTILRSTQFHELVPRFIARLPNVGLVPVPAGVRLQPIDEITVAGRIAELAESEPMGRVADIGGPEVLPMTGIARSYLRAIGSHRPVIPFPLFGKWSRAFTDGRMLTDNALPGSTYNDHLATIEPPVRSRAAALLRLSAVLFALNALWMAVSPDSFHTVVAPFGEANAHFIRDLATFNVPIVVGLWAAAERAAWRRPVVLIVMVQNGLHLVNHIADLDEPTGAAGVVNIALLAAFQLVLWFVWRTTREPAPTSRTMASV